MALTRRHFLKKGTAAALTLTVALPAVADPASAPPPAAGTADVTFPTPINPIPPESHAAPPTGFMSPAAYVPTLAEKAFPDAETVAPGKFEPNWESLHQYQFPEWFRDAKFGIWAHWGPQCQPEEGDWYAREMYSQYDRWPGSGQGKPNKDYVYHTTHYGPQSVFGFKDITYTWKAENWNPAQLLTLYKAAGAKYFMALANHHDNFDTWDSKYQPWNATKIGPHKNLIGGWSKAAQDAGLRFGVSVHSARAWDWNDGSKKTDTTGPLAGVPYDGNLNAADGKGQWWEGLDPQDLYAQNHDPKTRPNADYNRKFFNRTMDLINKYHPDLLYFDDDISGGLPLYNDDPTVGLRIAAHYYNTNMKQHGGRLDALIAGKKLTPERRECVLYDIERGAASEILPQPWQTDTCIGQWHYNKELAARNGYKKSPDVIRSLADIVSKNGNLMLSIPVRSDGTIDDHEIQFLHEMGAWLSVNGEGIYATRPWKVYGEGPAVAFAAAAAATPPPAGAQAPSPPSLGPTEVRYTASKDGKTLYAIVLGWPTDGKVTLRACAAGAATYPGEVASIALLGSDNKPTFTHDADALHITLPAQKPGIYAESAVVLKIAS